MKTARQGGFLLAKVHRLSGRVFSRLLRAYGVEANSAQGRVLFALWQKDRVPIGELARKTSLGKSSLTSMLDRLEALGYVERVPDPQDRRVVLVARTDKDRTLEVQYWQVSEAMAGIFYAGFSPGEIDVFERDLTRILNNLSKAEGAPSRKKVV